MTAAFWSFPWTEKFRELDLSEVMQVITLAEEVKREKQAQACKRA